MADIERKYLVRNSEELKFLIEGMELFSRSYRLKGNGIVQVSSLVLGVEGRVISIIPGERSRVTEVSRYSAGEGDFPGGITVRSTSELVDLEIKGQRYFLRYNPEAVSGIRSDSEPDRENS